MLKQNKPVKVFNVLEKIHTCIKQERYVFTNHALDRVKERGIDIQTTIYVLLNGHEEKQKTKLDVNTAVWKYAIRGVTVDSDDVRVIVAFENEDMLVITVMYVL